MMTTSGARSLPQPPWSVRKVLMSRPMKPGTDAAVEWILHVLRVIGSPAYPTSAEAMRERALASVQRAWHPAGSARQLLAVVADGDRTPLLSRITAPTRIVHGVADPLVPVACGHHLAEHILGAESDFIPGMGHDLPEPLLSRFAQGVAALAARATS
jgi:pimeloyl-ACP methyl ester carboxylesterase